VVRITDQMEDSVISESCVDTT